MLQLLRYPPKFKEDLKARNMTALPALAAFRRPVIYFTYLLRMAEYLLGRKDPVSRFAGRYYRFAAKRYGAKYGVSIPVGSHPGPGLFIMHFGGIVVSGEAIIGKNCRIHAGVNIGSNRFGVPRIGDDVYIGPGAKLFGDIEIGDGAQIGANSVVSRSVPARSVVSGPHARVIFCARDADHDSASDCRPGGHVESAPSAPAARRKEVLSIITQEVPGFAPGSLDLPFDDAGIDSFSLMSLRSALETGLRTTIPDTEWGRVGAVSDILALPSLASDAKPPQSSIEGPSSHFKREPAAQIETAINRLSRSYIIGMPQMALSGLGEPWLFKEVGDMHWSMLGCFLGRESSRIADSAGNRLYATFARVRIEVGGTLRSFTENEAINLTGQLSRFGANVFFSDQLLSGMGTQVRINAMSSFAMHAAAGDNTSLMRGNPPIPDPDALPSLDALPPFAIEYKTERENDDDRIIFQTDYEIMPPHDINGVGLIYFAAYPSIFDICVERYEGKGFLTSNSVEYRDVCYLSNARPDEILTVILHDRQEEGGTITHKGSIYRSSDMKRMAVIVCSRKRVD